MSLPALTLALAALVPGQAARAAADEAATRDFARHMLALQGKHGLAPFARYDSKRFIALSNAGEDFTARRLRECEVLYDHFYRHFRRKGFALHAPDHKLMLAVFDSPAGFEAYLDRKMAAGVTGVYHPGSNRLVLYDLGRSPVLLAERARALEGGKRLGPGPQRAGYAETVERVLGEAARDAALGTTMHEVAHQLSFNSGLLNRAGDVPLWLAEGLACYCESTEGGDWQPPGSPNLMRADDLRGPVGGRGRLVPLRTLLTADDWRSDGRVQVGYAQSWALFRLLMHERPRSLRRYLALIHERRTPDHRLTDFAEAFGPDLAALERRYRDYLRELAEDHPPRDGRRARR